jgi:geranylgeranyl diphosphate synthase, type I
MIDSRAELFDTSSRDREKAASIEVDSATSLETSPIGDRSASNVLAWTQALIQPMLRAQMDRLSADLRHIGGYHFGWWDVDGSPERASSGKAVRPALALLVAEAMGGTAWAAAPAAVAVELAHNFSLVHDDIIDGDHTRRRRPTVCAAFGTAAAILAGDTLLLLALRVLADEAPVDGGHGLAWLSDTLLRLAEGERRDVAFEAVHDAELGECIAMAAAKTGALFSCACALGAARGGADAARVELMREFGEHLGVAFQLVDDVLGIWGDPQVTGKPILADLRTRKKSLPVVAALVSGSAAGRELAEIYRQDAPLDEAALRKAADLIVEAGGRAWAQEEAARRLGAALSCLQAAGPRSRPARELTALAHLITRRDQ